MIESHIFTDRVLDHLIEVGEVRGCTRWNGHRHRYFTALQVLTETIMKAPPQESVTAVGDPLYGAYCMARAAVIALEELELVVILRAQGGSRSEGNWVERVTLVGR